MILQKTLLLVLLACALAAKAQPLLPAVETAEQQWAKKQMRHMLADRPIMKNYHVGQQILWVTQQDSIWQWVAERYAGKTTKFWTAWHEAEPIDDAGAMHAYGKDKAYLSVEVLSPKSSSDHNETFEKLWFRVVFELLNLENAAEFHQTDLAAYEGKCTRDEHIRTVAALEHRALGKQQQFYSDVWLPWCNATGLVSDPSIWRNNYRPDFEAWIAQYPAMSYYPWKIYGESYDQLRAEGEKKLEGSSGDKK